MNEHDINRSFQRNFLPGTIGLLPEDERDYYARLQHSREMKRIAENSPTAGHFHYDNENQKETYIPNPAFDAGKQPE